MHGRGAARPMQATAVLVAVIAASFVAATTASGQRAHLRAHLPGQTLRGPENLLLQYPEVSLATPAQRASAAELLREIRAAARQWGTLKDAEAAGFDTRTAVRKVGDRTVHYLHAEHRRYANDPTHLDPRQPKALIYANVPGFPLILVGVMFSMPRGELGITPGGPITRWHTHRVCARGNKRGLAPLADGSCPRGATARQGSEMMHVWFTKDLRSAFAIHAPLRELGLAGLIPAAFCKLG